MAGHNSYRRVAMNKPAYKNTEQAAPGGSAIAGKTRRRAKGEQTRRKILTATLKVMAREGSRGVTHRAVASEAGVQLSLTTYYFKDIDAMIREAFAQMSEAMQPELETTWSGVFEYLESFSAADLRKLSVREQVCERLAKYATDYIFIQATEKPDGLAVEQIFFSHGRLSPELRRMGAKHRASLLEPLVALCARFNRKDPEIDAELLLDTITALEYQSLGVPVEQIDRKFIHRLMRRHIGWIVGLKRA